ncbi:MAG: ATP-dependent DNA helicase [Acidimicrobiales bacterium]
MSSEPGPGAGVVADVLSKVAARLAGGGEHRAGQVQMAEAVEQALDQGRHLIVRAGTGTGKSLAYLLPVLLSGRRAVIATATKALQDQLAAKDLPLVASVLGDDNVRFAVLKGRANYICRQRVVEVGGHGDSGAPVPAAASLAGGPEALVAETMFDDVSLDEASSEESGDRRPDLAGEDAGDSPQRIADQVRALVAWSEGTSTGDRAELTFEPSPRAWSMVSVTARDCPGAFQCPSGSRCFAEHARARANAAQVVVVNTHLYATHVASDGMVLPEHDVLVLDEAHAVEDVMTAGLGVELTPGRLRAVAGAARVLVDEERRREADSLIESGDQLASLLAPRAGQRVRNDAPSDSELFAALTLAASRCERLAGAVRRDVADDDDRAPRRTRALLALGRLREELTLLAGNADDEQVAWVEQRGRSGQHMALRAAPVDVGAVLAARTWPAVTAVLTSATIPPRLGSSLGLPRQRTDRLDAGSPFPYETATLLYCPVDLPDRRGEDADAAIATELHGLIQAAGGRTLALFTSWRAMRKTVEALRPALRFTVLAQGDRPKAALLEAFTLDEQTCLFATMSFWQGVDVPGSTLSLVALDRLPFPRPDDPLLQARRERAGDGAFQAVDLPRAATMLAQGAGRLVRSASDRGVVAVLDRRLVTASYGAMLRGALPPMPLTTDREVARKFLNEIAASAAGARDAAPGRRRLSSRSAR